MDPNVIHSFTRLFPATTMDLFDDDDSDHDDDTTIRPAEHGILQFHSGTEDALLLHVQQRSNGSSVTSSMDDFCHTRHWMMHCGPEKGKILIDFLLERYQKRTTNDAAFVIVELGSYCGYSAIRMAQCCTSSAADVTIYSIDIDPKLVHIANEMASMAGVADRIQFLLRTDDVSLDSLLTSSIPNSRRIIDLLVLDHAKELYLQDLLHLEDTHWLQSGSAVFADNVIFAEIDDYVEYMKKTNESIQESRTIHCLLEYSQNVPDGIGRSFIGNNDKSPLTKELFAQSNPCTNNNDTNSK